MESNILKKHLEAALHWLTEVACNYENTPIGAKGQQMPTTFWLGAIRGEYKAATQTWDSFCPIWHTGQAVKALVLASQALNKPELLEKAKFSAEFILNNQFKDGEIDGLIAAYEDYPQYVNTSAILESLDGLFLLSKATNDTKYSDAAIKALYWVKNNLWDPEIKLFYDVYDPVAKKIIHGVEAAQNRPLLDDAVFVKGWQLTGDKTLLQVALDTADTLFRDENPVGNWIKYIPCSPVFDSIHPRHAYWWGNPMLDIYNVTKEESYKECFIRATNWYRKALRTDGGLFRRTSSTFMTDSFGHATSGTACAVLMFLRYLEAFKDKSIIPDIEKGLTYCCSVQFTNPKDKNLQGAILEKITPPDGTDNSPYYLRDLATIFFIQAASEYLKSQEQGLFQC